MQLVSQLAAKVPTRKASRVIVYDLEGKPNFDVPTHTIGRLKVPALS